VTRAPGGTGAAGFLLDDGAGGTRALHGFSVVVALWTLALLFVGGLVTSREAGLSVPDWPLSYGHVNPPGWTTTPNVREEHLHRLLGWGLGMQVIALAAWIQAADARAWMRRLGWIALGLVVVQGVLGGLRVVLLQHCMAVIHGALGQGLFCLLVAIALFTSRGWRDAAPPAGSADAARMHRRALLAALAVYLQVIIGAVIRHSRVGHSVPHVAPHAIFALVVAHLAVSAMTLALGRCAGAPGLRVPALLLGAGTVVQFLLGLGTYVANTKGVGEYSGRPPFQFWTATAHQAAGAVVLAAAVVLYLRSRRMLAAPGTLPGRPEGAPGGAAEGGAA
jgi:cytochrome c oxidase assembly protein subunit 15